MIAARTGRLAAACALGILATACGGQSPEPQKPTTAPDTTPTPSTAAVSIVAPAEGSSVRGRLSADGRVAATIAVRGRADALQTVRVDGRCAARSCTRIIYTGARGEWKARLRLMLPPRTRRWTVSADYAVTSVPGSAAKATFAIHATRPAARPRRPAASHKSSPRPATPTTTTETPPPAGTAPSPPSSGARTGTLVMVGDSLAVGVRTLLPAALPGWSVQVLARTSRPLAEGMQVLSSLDLAGAGQGTPPVVALSLFTNDDPTHTSALQAAVRRTQSVVGSRGCVIWATIARPPVNGVSYQAANALLERLAASDPRLVIVPWAQAVAANPSLVGADGVHPTPAGYQLRARLYARAAQSCP
jgi:hypothetical protein